MSTIESAGFSYPEKNKKELHFNHEKCECLIPVSGISIPESVRDVALRHGLGVKPEFHITVLAGSNARRINRTLSSPEEADAMKQKIQRLFEGKRWDHKPTEEYFLIEKFYSKEELSEMGFPDIPEHTKMTVIQKLALDDLEGFYKELSEVTGLEFITPFPHVTLFSTASYEPWKSKGIGVYSDEELASYLREKIEVRHEG